MHTIEDNDVTYLCTVRSRPNPVRDAALAGGCRDNWLLRGMKNAGYFRSHNGTSGLPIDRDVNGPRSSQVWRGPGRYARHPHFCELRGSSPRSVRFEMREHVGVRECRPLETVLGNTQFRSLTEDGLDSQIQ
ncbi:hypothetical protein J6590_025603 [Homalodisca vitripennis]|nr:hypothetical protein J6590_025603 [Homalodisca vitripennis]